MSFLDLKNNPDNFLTDLQVAFEKEGKSSYAKDPNSYYPTLDAEGSGYALIRFLPNKDTSKTPYVHYHEHFFRGPDGKKVFYERCLTHANAVGECPVCASNSELWKFGDKSPERDLARKRKRKLKYVSNIYVVNDPANPDNNGKVFKFTYGKKIHDKILKAAKKSEVNPNYVPINPFNPYTGANFNLEIAKVDGNTNYDSCSFDKPSQLVDDQAALDRIANQLFDIYEEITPDKFKSETEIKKNLARVLGTQVPVDNAFAMPAENKSSDADASASLINENYFDDKDDESGINMDSPDEDNGMGFFKDL